MSVRPYGRPSTKSFFDFNEIGQILYAGIYIKCWFLDDQLLDNGRGQGHVTRFVKFGPNNIFGISEARHFNCCMLTETQENQCTHGRLPQKGVC